MIGRAKRSWRLFTSSKPGDRFQVRYYYRKYSSRGRSSLSRIFNIVVGSALAIFSAFFGWAPGPGLLTLVIGLMMVGGEILIVARLLDWAEVRLRQLARVAGEVWAGATPVGKALIILLILVCVAALVYGAYYLLFAG